MNEYHSNDSIQNKNKLDAAAILQLLATAQSEVFPSDVINGLSDLDSADAKQLHSGWDDIQVEKRRALLRQLVEHFQENFQLDYLALATIALDDQDSVVRTLAISLVSESRDPNPDIMSQLIKMATHDPYVTVRAEAVKALGNYVLMGELGDITAQQSSDVIDTVIDILTNFDEEIEVRRYALEAISNSSHQIVRSAIEDAYFSDNRAMKISSICAMGHTCDEFWERIILDEMNNEDMEICIEAVRAAGEIGLRRAIPLLIDWTQSDHPRIKQTAIWSLGEIGGNHALDTLSALADIAEAGRDDLLLDIIEDAIANASLSEISLTDDEYN